MTCRRAFSPLIIAAVLGVCSPRASDAAGQAGQALNASNVEQSARKLRREPGKPIDSQLGAADKEVEVVDDGATPGLRVLDESGLVLESMTKAFDLVALVKVAQVTSDFTKDRSWVTSTVEAEILEVLKSSPEAPRQYVVGEHIAFARQGGVVRVNQKTVRARVSWARSLAEQQTYLVFGWHPKRELDIPLDAVYQVVGPRLRSVVTEGGGKDDIEKDTWNGVRARVKRALGVK